MPDDLDGGLDISVLHSRHVGQVVVALRAVIVEPTHDVQDTLQTHVDVRHTPDDFHALDRVAELLAQRSGRRVSLAAAVGHVVRSHRGRRVAERASVILDLEPFANSPYRFWCAELPNGSDSSSMTGAGMYSWLFG